MRWELGNISLLADEISEPYQPDGNEDVMYIGLEHVEPQTLKLLSVGSSLDVQSSKQKFNEGDILFGTMRPYFRKVVRPKFDGICSTEFSVIRAKRKQDAKYVFYHIAQEKFIEFATTNSKGDRPRTTWGLFSRFPAMIPPPKIRERIGAILSAYDDLIENNLRRIKLLEESARQLYKEWFVRLRFPGYEHTKIVNGVPEGWERDKVGKLILKFDKKKRIPKEYYIEEGVIPCIDQSSEFIGGYTNDTEAVHSDPLPIIVFGDHTRILKFVSFPFASGADGTQLLYPNRSTLSPEYFYLALQSIDLSNYFYARHFKFLKQEMILIPINFIIKQFTEFIMPIFKQVSLLRFQNQKLRQARDLLLPKLMSGEVEI